MAAPTGGLKHQAGALTGSEVRPMNRTPQPPVAAGEHFATPSGSWPPYHSSSGLSRIATSRSRFHATLAVAAILAEEDNHDRR